MYQLSNYELHNTDSGPWSQLVNTYCRVIGYIRCSGSQGIRSVPCASCSALSRRFVVKAAIWTKSFYSAGLHLSLQQRTRVRARIHLQSPASTPKVSRKRSDMSASKYCRDRQSKIISLPSFLLILISVLTFVNNFSRIYYKCTSVKKQHDTPPYKQTLTSVLQSTSLIPTLVQLFRNSKWTLLSLGQTRRHLSTIRPSRRI